MAKFYDEPCHTFNEYLLIPGYKQILVKSVTRFIIEFSHRISSPLIFRGKFFLLYIKRKNKSSKSARQITFFPKEIRLWRLPLVFPLP